MITHEAWARVSSPHPGPRLPGAPERKGARCGLALTLRHVTRTCPSPAQGAVPGGQAGSWQGWWAAVASGPRRAFGEPGWGPSPGRANPGCDLLLGAAVDLTTDLPTAATRLRGPPGPG